jgi:DNA-binding transcriptional ArsR family regulator
MPEHTTIAAEYASAVAHPVRFQLVAALADGPRTLESLASELDASAATILLHAGALEGLEVLRAIDHGDGTRTYELLRDPVLWDTAWGRLPVAAKRAAAAAAITQMAAIATAAVDRGGFDRADIHLTRTAIQVDEARWRELAALLAAPLHTLGDIAEAPAPDGSTGPTFQATAVMMLFTGEQTDHGDAPTEPWDEAQALKRTWELGEELEDLAPREVTDWDRIETLAGELRLIARAMKAHRRPPDELLHRD